MKRLMSFIHQHFSIEDLVLIDEKNRTLYTQVTTPHQELYLASCAEGLLQFIKPQKGEIFVTNDLSAGACNHGHLCFLFMAHENSYGKIFGLIRTSFLPLTKIPPIPLVQNGQIALDLFDVIFQSYEWKQHLLTYLRNELDQLHRLCETLSRFFQHESFLKNRDTFFLSEKNKVKSLIAERPMGISSGINTLENKLAVRLKLNMSEQFIHFDFSGSSESPQYGIPSSMTSSLAFSVLSHVYRLPCPYHHAHFSQIQTTFSPRSILSSNLKNQDQWMNESALTVVTNLLYSCFEKVHRKSSPQAKTLSHEKAFIFQNQNLFELNWRKMSFYQSHFSVKLNEKPILATQLFDLFPGFCVEPNGFIKFPKQTIQVAHMTPKIQSVENDEFISLQLNY